MKSIHDYLAQDMWGNHMMSGEAVYGCVTMTSCKTKKEQLEYCQGIMTMFPHMLFMNFSNWYFDGSMPKDYKVFLEASLAPLQAQVFPVLDRYFAEASDLSEQERGALLVPILTDLVPKHVLTGYHNYMFADSGKDIDEFLPTVQPLMNYAAKALTTAYEPGVTPEEKAEAFEYLDSVFPFVLLKRWYEWMFGKEKMEMPPPPPQD